MAKSLRMGNVALAVLIASAALCGSVLFAAQPPAPPDFATDDATSWIPVGDDYLPPASGPGPITFDPAHPYIPNFTGKQPTYRVADLTNPILQPWAAAQMRKANEAVLAGHVPFRARESCWPPGVPTFLVYALATPLYFLQTRNLVAIFYQGGPELRHVYMDVPHSAHPALSWYGESVGHYEGDSLVVDTIGLDDRTPVDGFGTPHTKQLHVIERFHLIENGNVLEANIHVEDPGAFTMPWNAIQRFRQYEAAVRKVPIERLAQLASAPEGPLQEMRCADNPNSFFPGTVALPLPQAMVPDF